VTGSTSARLSEITLEPDTLSEAALTDLLRRRHAPAFKLVVQRHNRRLYRVARAILNDDAEAEDVVQEAYVRALTNLDRFEGKANVSTWLTRIVINEALGRRRTRRPMVELAAVDGMRVEEDEMARTMTQNLADDGPERAAARAELRRLIERAVDQLPESFRLVFVLRAVEGLSIEETAGHLGIPAATVKTRFHRARNLLQDALDDAVADVLKGAFPFAGRRCEEMTSSVLARMAARSDEAGNRRRSFASDVWRCVERLLAGLTTRRRDNQ
jgi:RNA polymerase sigma-70 factor, ECF subfamily